VLWSAAWVSTLILGVGSEALENHSGGRRVWAERAALEVFYRRLEGPGEATPVVLLHPWGLDHRVWAEVAPALARDRTVVLVDLPAHGRSDTTHTAWSMARLAWSVVDVLDAAGLSRALVVGNSLGGATALEVARLAPSRVVGVGLIAAPGGRRLAAPLRRLARQLATAENLRTLSDEAWQIGLAVALRGADTDTTQALLAARREPARWRAFSRSAAAVLLEVADYAPDLSSVDRPALVLHGTADLLIDAELSAALADGLPQGRMRRLEGCGHLPELECPEALLAALRPFLDAPERPKSPPGPHAAGARAPSSRSGRRVR
jgi:pimeloyl-ACP methyl ester carboxylesterase